LSRIRTFSLGPFEIKRTFWKVFFPIQFASSWRFQQAATGEFFVKLKGITVTQKYMRHFNASSFDKEFSRCCFLKSPAARELDWEKDFPNGTFDLKRA